MKTSFYVPVLSFMIFLTACTTVNNNTIVQQEQDSSTDSQTIFPDTVDTGTIAGLATDSFSNTDSVSDAPGDTDVDSDTTSSSDVGIGTDSLTPKDSEPETATDSTTDSATDSTADSATDSTTDSATDTGTDTTDTDSLSDSDFPLPGICGNSVVETAEGCDDGNAVPFDGCSAQCTTEPDCTSGSCVSSCGDGIMLGTEACDDGNLKNGDGCNDNCEVEAGFTCLQRPCKEGGNCPQRIDLDVIYRDFAAGSVTDPDFGQPSCRTLTKGLVANELDSNWKPVYAGPAYGCIEELNKWYTRQSAKTTQLKLYADGEGGYVNRYGENGEQWYGYAPDPHSELGEPLAAETWQGQGGTRYVDCKAYGCVICPWDTTGDPQGCVPPDYGYDGNPLFFPLDDLLPTAACTLENSVIDMNHEDACAKIPARYGYTGWPWEAMWSDDAHTHNFYFTSEIIFWFVYEPNKQATLSFTGDDDVWVFVNGQLAIDLGGVHVPETGSVRLTNAADPNPADSNDYGSFGMITGGVYPIHLFHTDRMVEGSSFKLHIRDFTLPNLFPSECHSVK